MREKPWNLSYVHLIVIELLIQSGSYLVTPLLAGFAVSLGATVAVGGFLAGLNATASFFTRPFSGLLADRVSKGVLLVASCLLMSSMSFGIMVSETELTAGICRALQGCAFAFKSVAIVSLIPGVVPSSHLARAVGWFGLVAVLASSLGPSIGSAVVSHVGYGATFALAGVLMLGGTVLAAAFVMRHPELGGSRKVSSQTKEEGFSLVRFVRNFVYVPGLPLSLTACLVMMAQGSIFALMLPVGECCGISDIAVYYVVFALSSVVTRPVVGAVADKRGAQFVIVPMAVLSTVGMIVMMWRTDMTAFVINAVLTGAGISSIYSTTQAETMRRAGTGEVGRATNTFYLGPDIGIGLGASFGGVAFQAGGAAAFFAFNAAVIVAGLFVAVSYFAFTSRHASAKAGRDEEDSG